jgi:hypothetical protein
VLEVQPDEVERLGRQLGELHRRERQNGPDERVAAAEPVGDGG